MGRRERTRVAPFADMAHLRKRKVWALFVYSIYVVKKKKTRCNTPQLELSRFLIWRLNANTFELRTRFPIAKLFFFLRGFFAHTFLLCGYTRGSRSPFKYHNLENDLNLKKSEGKGKQIWHLSVHARQAVTCRVHYRQQRRKGIFIDVLLLFFYLLPLRYSFVFFPFNVKTPLSLWKIVWVTKLV